MTKRFAPLPKHEGQTFPVRVDGKIENRPVGPEHQLAIVDGKHLQVVRRDKLRP